MSPQEQLPDLAPMPTFFLPNFLGILFALGMEKLGMEQRLTNILAEGAHPYCLLGMGIFWMANVNSYLGGSVVCARIQYGVKLPNLYAASSSKSSSSNTTDSNSNDNQKDAVCFNCIQRGHQNFLENYAQLVLSVLFTALVANRPNVAGMILWIVAICRVFYAIRYRVDIQSRIGPLLVSMFSMSIGVGYAFLIGLTAMGIHVMT